MFDHAKIDPLRTYEAVCGPPVVYKFVLQRLLELGLPKNHILMSLERRMTGDAVAPRGLLIHSYEYDADGRVVSPDVITPTALNAASLEQHLRRAMEQSAEREEAAVTRKLGMIARAYDPCISCSVHLIRR